MKQVFTLQYWKGQRLLLLAFLLVHVVVAAIHISSEGITDDEPDYYTYAARWAHGNVERADKMYDSKSPIVAIALIPRIIKQLQYPNYKASDNGLQDVKNGRYFMVVFTIIIALYLFIWTRKLFGAKAWILPMLFFLFDPMVISFAMIITSDMATGACIIATMYHLYRFYKTKRWKHFIMFSIWLGVGFVCKASLLFLVPCLVCLYVLLLITGRIKLHLKSLFIRSLVTSIISLLIINLAYFGKNSFHTLRVMHFESTAFQSLAHRPLLNKIPIPLPENYVVSLDLLQYHTEIGAGKPESSYPGVFVNGKLKYDGGFWYYYLFIGFYKIPISVLMLLGIGIVTFFIGFRKHRFFCDHIWFVLPAVFFFVILSCFNPFQIGLRHLLVVYPLLFIAIGGTIEYWKQKWQKAILIPWLLFGYMIISVAIYFPNLISYTNEFLADKRTVFRKMRDGNVDYGQNADDIAVYLDQHPDTKIPGKTPKPGKYIVRMVELLNEGYSSAKPKYFWLLNYNPVEHYKYTMFIFNISEQDITSLQQKSRH